MIHGELKEKAAPAATGTAENSSGNLQESQAENDFIRSFWRFQNYLNQLKAIHLGDIPEPTGEFFGDGIPRTAGGYEFEPLSWGEVIRV